GKSGPFKCNPDARCDCASDVGRAVEASKNFNGNLETGWPHPGNRM
ncbi:uncharacterized protein METZ01_LOCUS290145, partial [marine metagenome]